MTTEFNLSKKILYKNKMGEMQDVFPDDVFLKKDIKEFVRLLKEELKDVRNFLTDKSNPRYETWITSSIDRLAGDKLKGALE